MIVFMKMTGYAAIEKIERCYRAYRTLLKVGSESVICAQLICLRNPGEFKVTRLQSLIQTVNGIALPVFVRQPD